MIFGSLYPVPPAPYNLLPYLFAGYLLLGGLWYGALSSRVAAIEGDLEM